MNKNIKFNKSDVSLVESIVLKSLMMQTQMHLHHKIDRE